MTMRMDDSKWLSLVAFVFLGIGAAVRLLPHPPNMTPLTAMALFAGATFPPAVAWVLAVGAMLVGDLALGWVPQNVSGYVAMAAVGAIGAWVRSRRRLLRLTGAALAGSSTFFLISNFGVWLEGWLYPRTWEGLVACYVAGIPFFRHQVVGDLVYTAVLFGGFAMISRRVAWRAAGTAWQKS